MCRDAFTGNAILYWNYAADALQMARWRACRAALGRMPSVDGREAWCQSDAYR